MSGFILGPTLETERLILRPPEEADFEMLAAMMGDEETARYITGPLNRRDSWRTLTANAGAWLFKGYSVFAVVEKESGAWLGRVGPLYLPDWPGTEVTWALQRRYWGKGYAFEAACACMDFVVDQLGWTEIIHCIDPENTASRRLAERLGSRILRQTSFSKEHVIDVWGQNRDTWLARRQ